MVINHTSRDWLDPALRWPRYYLIYGSVLLPAAIFLFLVGFVLPVPYHRSPQPAGPTALRHFRRGIRIIAGGYLLNLVVLRSQPVWSGGVLQTIGLSVIVLGLILPWMPHPWTRWILLGFAVGGYVAFSASEPALARWSVDHPIVSKAILKDFPPWPWLSAALLGLVSGWTWLDARKRGEAHEDRFFVATAALGIVLLLVYGTWEWWIPTSPRFGFARDFGLNGHWSPRGMTTFLVLGGVTCLLALTFWLMERRRLTAPWLVTLGQTALMLYFVHQLIELTLVNEILGIRFTHWSVYWITNAIFVVVLVYLGRAWLAIKARWRDSTWGARDASPIA
jgi:heparan-alpha-glucosaminide N-acetyltransferase-like protein